MEFKHTDGCTSFSLTVDDVETVDMPTKEIQAAIKVLVDKQTDIGALQSLLIDLIDSMGDEQYVGTCEECGDSIYTTTLKV